MHPVGGDEHPRRLLELPVRGEGHPERAQVVRGRREPRRIAATSLRSPDLVGAISLDPLEELVFYDQAGQIRTLPLRNRASSAFHGPRPRRQPRMTRAASRQNPTRIQRAKTEAILDAALDVFSTQGFRGATLDQLAEARGPLEAEPALLLRLQGRGPPHPARTAARHLARSPAPDRSGRRSADRDPRLCPAQARHGPRPAAREPPVRQRDAAGRAAHRRRAGRPAPRARRRKGRSDPRLGRAPAGSRRSIRTT